jgi:hypothetical protein
MATLEEKESLIEVLKFTPRTYKISLWGGSTDGKSSDFNMVLLTDDEGNFKRYESTEIDFDNEEEK